MTRNLKILPILCFLILLNLCIRTQAELFTAIAEVEHLLETHKRIIDDLDHYIDKEERRLATLKRHLNIYKTEHERAMEDIPNYLGNPINAFTLIKRLTTDLDHIESSIKIGTEYIKNITMNHEDVKYPALEDLTGAAQALTRLQKTYNLDVKDLAEGKLNGVAYSTPMSAGDCYELGRALYNERDYINARAWMMEALRKYEEENVPYPFTEVDILEYISFSYYLLGDTRSALEWTNKLLAVDPKHVRAKGNVPHYKKSIEEEEARLRKERRGETGSDEPKEKPVEVTETDSYAKERSAYEALCRGEMDIPVAVSKRLTCRYLTENHPFLRLAPIKMEMMYLSPDVVVFHDVLSDGEIEQIKRMAQPRFKRAVVHDPKTGELVPAHYRISKSSWLRDSESETIARITRRVSHMTGLSMDSAEELQVVNYGIGGHYEPHYDFARKRENAFSKGSGNRIATVLFYMSDVAQGGATVFTELGLSVFPQRRAAAFWLNLHPSGEGDLATRHAACPVLQGSKWVSNKWIHQGGQELLFPCNLEYQEEGFVRKILRPVPKTSR
ncbi:prolyl 4-hydroxylase subunit alpha-1-like [Trichoplusia ni]|uniref:procollagen-proline 4-dioxygenase n=1 Tax=Trichoplusia ni TaxID=7111 RepID=A0A7E5VX81_TRINI|nr:prolyl 4-hydroxylase subunit alpha-1-like [Trichoplusia ni]XP_026732727.1 prolyl 4-hydroxylase subunit alpha-1-like [Trichoplusia ni]XP_026732728.1 prolyl 4-hydroxylase subunit alpha-1-like [Trichoplusia ni]